MSDSPSKPTTPSAPSAKAAITTRPAIADTNGYTISCVSCLSTCQLACARLQLREKRPAIFSLLVVVENVSGGFERRGLGAPQPIPHPDAVLHVAARPALCRVEAIGAGVRLGAQAQLVVADLEQPVGRQPQQPLAGAQAFAARIDEQPPDRA